MNNELPPIKHLLQKVLEDMENPKNGGMR